MTTGSSSGSFQSAFENNPILGLLGIPLLFLAIAACALAGGTHCTPAL